MHLFSRARIGAFFTVGALSVLFAVACAGGGAGGSTVRMTEFAYEPAAFTATVGQPLRLNLQNGGSVIHDFHVRGLDVASPKVQPGQSMSFEFTPSRAGTFEVFCEEPGHEAGGMTGTLTVQ